LSNYGQREHARVHRVVAFAFLKHSNGKNEINHIDGNKHNNSASNLEWVSSKENKLHAISIGLSARTPNQKLTAPQIDYIQNEWPGGFLSAKSLAAEYGVTWSTIYNVKRGRTWN